MSDGRAFKRVRVARFIPRGPAPPDHNLSPRLLASKTGQRGALHSNTVIVDRRITLLSERALPNWPGSPHIQAVTRARNGVISNFIQIQHAATPAAFPIQPPTSRILVRRWRRPTPPSPGVRACVRPKQAEQAACLPGPATMRWEPGAPLP